MIWHSWGNSSLISIITGFVSTGFNAGIPDEADGSLGGGFTLNDTTLEIGLGAFLSNQTIGIAIIQDRATGQVTVTMNGKVVEL